MKEGKGNYELGKDWGCVSYWPSQRIERGDWTSAIWRSPELADAAAQLSECQSLKTMEELGIETYLNPSFMAHFERAEPFTPGSFHLLKSKGSESQTTIQSQPDEWWVHKKRDQKQTAKFIDKAGHLLITQGQDAGTARLIAVASDEKYFGIGWIPFPSLTAEQAQALAVFLNSTAGRMQLMRNAARKLNFPQYGAEAVANIRVPDVVGDAGVCRALKECWERTKNIRVPQYRDGDHWDGIHHPRHPKEKPENWIDSRKLDGTASVRWNAGEIVERAAGKVGVKHHACGVKQPAGGVKPSAETCGQAFGLNPRPIWDRCVSKTLKKNPLFKLSRLNHLRELLHREPHISGKPYHHRADELEDE